MNTKEDVIRLFNGPYHNLRGDNSDEGLMAYAIYMLRSIGISKHNVHEYPKQNARILELGCGDGLVTKRIKELRPDLEYTAMDICPKLTLKTAELNPTVHVMTGNCLHGIPTESLYDHIISFGFGQYFSHKEFINLNRMLIHKLAPGGTIIHCSIPDESKRWSHTFGTRKGLIPKVKGFLRYVIDSPQRRYGPASVWHDPYKLRHDLKQTANVTLLQPSDIDYRFDLFLSHNEPFPL